MQEGTSPHGTEVSNLRTTLQGGTVLLAEVKNLRSIR